MEISKLISQAAQMHWLRSLRIYNQLLIYRDNSYNLLLRVTHKDLDL